MNNKARGIEIGGRIYYFQDESQQELIEAVSGDVQTISGDLITLSQEVDEKASQSDFEAFSGEVSSELSGKASQSVVDALSGVVIEHTSNVDAHVTSAEKDYWNTQIQALWEAISGTPVPPPTPTTEYRWVVVADGYECSGTTKMTQEKEQFSTDSGATWNDVVPLTTRAALPVIEYNSVDCGYVPPSFKWEATYTTGTSSAECDGSSVITSGDGFHYNTELISIIIGECIDEIGVRAIDNCSSLTSVTLSNSVTSIGDYSFSSCKMLTSITIPDSATSIGNNAFWACSGLTNIEIPDSVISIGNAAFYMCYSISSITIGNSVTSIGYNGFSDCTSLQSITCLATTPPTLGSWAFDDTNNCPIYVPASSVAAYKTATNWSTYASRIQPIV